MDFREKNNKNIKRHPWEIVKAYIAHYLIGDYLKGNVRKKILDVGCGDCYFLKSLKSSYGGFHDYFGIDPCAPEGYENECASCGINFSRLVENPVVKRFNIILLMDVLEHVGDDIGMLNEMADRYSDKGSIFLITVPAFGLLFGAHDRFLRHKRRYTEKELVELAEKSGLERIESGYYFFSLLILRAAGICLEKMTGRKDSGGLRGIGGWEAGDLKTGIVVCILKVDFLISRLLKKFFINIPGLSTYILCRK